MRRVVPVVAVLLVAALAPRARRRRWRVAHDDAVPLSTRRSPGIMIVARLAEETMSPIAPRLTSSSLPIAE